MEQGFLHLDIVLLGLAAGFIIYRLANVLGRKTGHERERFNPYAGGPKAKPGAEPERTGAAAKPARNPEGDARSTPGSAPRPIQDPFADIAPKGSPLARALTEIQLADRNFEAKTFLAGARMAYEMIVTAFARGDKRELEPLLAEDVEREFFAVIDGRAQRGEHVDLSFVGIRTAEITEAALQGRLAEITVRVVSEIISCTKNADGAVIEGDPVTIVEVRDLWTFSRDTRGSDPNWQLVSARPA